MTEQHLAMATRDSRPIQEKLAASLKPHHDFIGCGSGSSGSVVAGRLAEHPGGVSVPLLDSVCAEISA
jgi:hypothetical protein